MVTGHYLITVGPTANASVSRVASRLFGGTFNDLMYRHRHPLNIVCIDSDTQKNRALYCLSEPFRAILVIFAYQFVDYDQDR